MDRLEGMKATANRLHLAHQDMREASDYLELFEDLHAQDFDFSSASLYGKDAAFVALVVVYSRPFVNSFSKGQADPKLLPEDIKLFEGEIEMECLHRRLIELRNTAIAHGDWKSFSSVLITDDIRYGLKREHDRPDYTRNVDISLLRRLIGHVKDRTAALAYDADVYYQTEVERRLEKK